MSEQGGAQTHYRCKLPALALIRLGYTAHVCQGFAERRDGKLRGLVDRATVDPMVPDLIVMRMTAHPQAPRLIHQARRAGQVVVCDIDDPIWQLPSWNPAADTFVAHDAIAATISACDAFTASTPGVYDMVVEHVPVAPPGFVCRNGVDMRAFPPRAYEPHRPLRLCWPGRTGIRSEDLAVIAPAVKAILDTEDVVLWHIGLDPHDTDIGDLIGHSGTQIHRMAWVALDDLPRAFAQVDLALLPQRACPFAESRSTATGLAMAAAGTPFLSSPTSEYLRLAADDVGECVEDGEWEAVIRQFVRSRTALNLSSALGRENMAKHDIGRTVEQWLRAFEETRETRAVRA